MIALRTPESAELLFQLDRPIFAVEDARGVVLTDTPRDRTVVASAPALPIDRFGAASFRSTHGVRACYVAGAMAGGIGSARLVIEMGRNRLLAGFGAGGLELGAIEDAVRAIQRELGRDGPYEINLLHAPLQPDLEMALAERYLELGVPRISASGFMTLTPAVVLYRARGLSLSPSGRIEAKNHILAKISRPEIAEEFMRPAADDLLRRLVSEGRITEEQARLASEVPVAEDITAEGDSGGHTDRRPTIPLLSSILELRDRIVEGARYPRPIRVGCAGGIGTPSMVLAAFVAGADYVMTGSINQACVEAGTSDLVKSMLAKVDIGGVDMAPAADMFELGVKVQVLKQGTLFVPRAERLYRLYTTYDAIEEIPADELAQLEKQIFRRSIAEVWDDTQRYLKAHAPRALDEARTSPKKRMGLIFRWYLGMASRWAIGGVAERKVDFQVWCGSAMAAFNRWVSGTPLEKPENRRVVDIADRLLEGASALYRARMLQLGGVELPASWLRHRSLERNAP